MNLTPKISVIVPVYKVEQYIHRCIDSILSQSFTDFELILVNDGSPDNCGKICDEYAQKDSRVRVFHKTNGGVSSARNLGLDNARGKYLCFIDADDIVTPQHLNELVSDMELEENVGLVIQGTRKFFPNGTTRDYIPQKKICSLQENDQLYYSIYQYIGPVSKLFQHDVIKNHHLLFNTNLVVAEDYDFLLRYLYQIKKIHVSDKVNYFIYSHEGSLSSRIYTFEQEFVVFRNAYNLATAYSNIYKHGEWFSFPSFLLTRTLFSNYLNVYNKKQRLEHLNKFSYDERRMFRKNFKANTLFLKFIKFLYAYHMYLILDTLMHWRIKPNKK